MGDRLLGTECRNRIDARGAACGEDRRGDGDNGQHCRHCRICDRIVGTETAEKASYDSRGGQGSGDAKTKAARTAGAWLAINVPTICAGRIDRFPAICQEPGFYRILGSARFYGVLPGSTGFRFCRGRVLLGRTCSNE
jgi:hypothetical protein